MSNLRSESMCAPLTRFDPAVAAKAETSEFAYRMLEESSQFRGRSDSFTISQSGDVLTIWGCVPSFYLKQVLQELLMSVVGVRSVKNQVTVVALDSLSSAP